MLKNLFSSTIRIKLLTLFLTNPNKNFYLREIQRLVNKTLSAIRQELINLEQIKFITSHSRGKIKYYQVNQQHPLYPELKSIIYKTSALGDLIREKLKDIPGIEAAIIYGSIAKDKERPGSDIDLLIIGTPDYDNMYDIISEIEQNLHREVNFVTFTSEQWKEKVNEKSSFVMDILNNKTISITGDINEL